MRNFSISEIKVRQISGKNKYVIHEKWKLQDYYKYMSVQLNVHMVVSDRNLMVAIEKTYPGPNDRV